MQMTLSSLSLSNLRGGRHGQGWNHGVCFHVAVSTDGFSVSEGPGKSCLITFALNLISRIHKKPHKNWNNLSGRFLKSKELDTSGLRCQRFGLLKEQISGLLGDKILDQSFQNGNFSPKPNLTQGYLTSTWRSPLRESHVTNI